jgi:hypothetical protein
MKSENGTKKCFIISVIDEPGTVEREKADSVKNNIIVPALKGFEVERADDIGDYKEITDKIFDAIRKATVITADVSGKNENVWYELGIAHSLRKPVIHLMEKGTKIPFDVKNTPFIIYDNKNYGEAIKKVEKQLDSIKNDEQIVNPFSKGLSLISTNEHLKLFESVLGLKRVQYIDDFIDYCNAGIEMLKYKSGKYGIMTVNTPVKINETTDEKTSFDEYINKSIEKVINEGIFYRRLYIINGKLKDNNDICGKLAEFVETVYEKDKTKLIKGNIVLGFVNEKNFPLYRNIDFYFTSNYHFSIAFLSLSNPETFGKSIHCYDVENKISKELQKEIDSEWTKNKLIKKFSVNTKENKEKAICNLKKLINKI